jgi:pilus assembly protein Flp/PilA
MKLLTSLYSKFSRFTKDEEGAAAIEYAVIAGLIIALAIGSITTIGTEVRDFFAAIVTALA